jgi:stage II sporulation protein D
MKIVRFKYSAFFLLFFLPFIASSVNISVHIYSTSPVNSVIVAPSVGKYVVLADGKTIDSCNSQSVYEITILKDSVVLKALGKTIGKFASVRFHGYGIRNQFNIRPISTTSKTTRLYDDDLIASSETTELKLLNISQIEHYIAGVIESEAGRKKPLEYFKVQAIICRTYALTNLAKHILEGCELCDGVHCQVYQGAATTPLVIEAVEATKNMVLVDVNDQLIDAAFHSNCGGYTLNSEDVWNAPLSYLKSVRDTFCLHQPSAVWEKHFSTETWENYFNKKEKGLRKDTLRKEAFWDSIPMETRIYMYDRGYVIPLKDIRLDLNLHSTCFSIVHDSNGVTLHGRGYGHRVGLCQEGAIHMSQIGYNYQQILHYYYTDVQLIDFTILPSSGFN